MRPVENSRKGEAANLIQGEAANLIHTQANGDENKHDNDEDDGPLHVLAEHLVLHLLRGALKPRGTVP
jgi:hypothetical protein